ncbi:hypothetical protein [Fictibacillus sp. KU28468]|uniref:hypothetical protein n=1 Tax=Fictibacillus sp. KU28468 TaxID=2991053 RepID=UPI00223CD9D2|nr:hypothetical protein [Fictibacillus sp. KU28468]UZJ79783.1 hypothetical protein OKX00_04720 [Fictibacillus sp. KU28468]
MKIFQAKKGLPEGQFSTFWTAPFLYHFISESEAVHHEELHQLYEDIFGQDRKILFAGFEGKKNLSILAVSRNGELAGFKMGYEQNVVLI